MYSTPERKWDPTMRSIFIMAESHHPAWHGGFDTRYGHYTNDKGNTVAEQLAILAGRLMKAGVTIRITEIKQQDICTCFPCQRLTKMASLRLAEFEGRVRVATMIKNDLAELQMTWIKSQSLKMQGGILGDIT